MNVTAAVAAYAATLDPRQGHSGCGRFLGYDDDQPVFADPKDAEEVALAEMGKRLFAEPANARAINFEPITSMLALRSTVAVD